MNVDTENQENFKKKKKIIVISLSATLVFVTLIAGLFLVKKNKESNRESNNTGKVVNENKKKPRNKIVIANKNDYFFNKTYGQATINILSLIVIGILFFFVESKKAKKSNDISQIFYGSPYSLFGSKNFNGLLSLVNFVAITISVEVILNQLLICSIAHFFSKDKNKRYLYTFNMFRKKRSRFFSSFFIDFIYLLYAFTIATVIRSNLCACIRNQKQTLLT